MRNLNSFKHFPLLFLCSLLRLSVARADFPSIQVPLLAPMDNAKMSELIASIHEVVAGNQSYLGKEPAGKLCGLRVSASAGDTLVQTNTGNLPLRNPITEAVYFLLEYLFDKSPDGTEQHLHFAIITHPQETMGRLDVIDIYSKSGVPFKAQSLAGFPAGSRFHAGDDVKLILSSPCLDLGIRQ